jgi:hypothetical protein
MGRLAFLSRLTSGFRFSEGFILLCARCMLCKGQIQLGKSLMAAFQPALGRQMLAVLRYSESLQYITLLPVALR